MEYLILIYEDERINEARDPKANDELMQAYYSYTEQLKQAGVLMGGNALHTIDTATSVRVREGRTLTTDGPFAETKEQLGGYYQIRCENLDEALKWAALCPSSATGTIEVRPILNY